MKFLGRARKLFQALAPEPETPVQYFNVLCASGHRVRGERTEGYQALRCPACGEGVFVLPRSPLPEPVAPERPSTAKAAGMGERWVEEGPIELTDAERVSVDVADGKARWSEAEIIWDEAPVETPSPVVPSPVRGRVPVDDVQIAGPPDGVIPERAVRGADAQNRGGSQRRPRKPAQEGRATPRVGGDVPEGATIPAENDRRRRSRSAATRQLDQSESAPEPAVLQPKLRSRTRTLNRWLFVLVPLLVIATVAWRLRRSQMQEYPLMADRGRKEGIPALEAGDFDKAFQLLADAEKAVNALGGDVEGADEVRQASKQAAIFNTLLSETLEELLDKAGQTDSDTWANKFDTLYKGKAIIVDSWIKAEPDPAGSGRYDILYRVVPPGEGSNFREGALSLPARIGVIDFTGFQLFELATPHVGERKIFGARLSGFKRDNDRDLWVIQLEPKSGVFITHTKALERIGWQDGSEIVAPKEDQQ